MCFTLAQEGDEELEQLATRLEKQTNRKTGKGGAMSDVTLATELIREAYPTARYGNAKAAIWAAYRGLHLKSVRRARSLYNGEARRVDAHEMDALRRAAIVELHNARIKAKARIEALEHMATVQGNRGLQA